MSTATRERIALVIANTNGCDHCNSAHTFLAKSLAKLKDAEIAANRAGSSTDATAHAADAFALKNAAKRGHISSDDLFNVQAAGYSNAEIIEIIGHIALNIFTNYVNEAFETEVDFPLVKVAHAA